MDFLDFKFLAVCLKRLQGCLGKAFGVLWIGFGVPWDALGRSLGAAGEGKSKYTHICERNEGPSNQVYKAEVAARWPRGGRKVAARWPRGGCKEGARHHESSAAVKLCTWRAPWETYQKKKRRKEILRPPRGKGKRMKTRGKEEEVDLTRSGPKARRI